MTDTTTRPGTTVALDIGGITCASCAARLTKRLNKLDGVDASVNYATEQATITLPDGLTVDDVVAQVEAIGYTARVPAAAQPDTADDEGARGNETDPELTALRNRLIVAAVLGVIKTMGSISSPPEVLGHMIGGALVGTFLGVFVSYGFFGPMAQSLRNIYEAEHKYYLSMKTGLLAHIAGYAPVMAIEFARKMLMSEDRPTFTEIDQATADLPALAA